MHTVIIWSAQYLLWAMVAVCAAVWLFAEDRPGKVSLAVTSAAGLAVLVVLMYVAKNVHHDPRPFVQNPHIKPLFAHGTDDGFPSDHSMAAALMAVLIGWRHRLLGLLLGAAAGVVAWARVAAHVHHLQDVVAGLLLGAVAALVAIVLVPAVTARIGRPAWGDARPSGVPEG